MFDSHLYCLFFSYCSSAQISRLTWLDYVLLALVLLELSYWVVSFVAQRHFLKKHRLFFEDSGKITYAKIKKKSDGLLLVLPPGLRYATWMDDIVSLKSAHPLAEPVLKKTGLFSKRASYFYKFMLPELPKYNKDDPRQNLRLGFYSKKPLFISNVSSVLLAGKSGSGKSILLQNLVAHALKNESEVTVIDAKAGQDFSQISSPLLSVFDYQLDDEKLATFCKQEKKRILKMVKLGERFEVPRILIVDEAFVVLQKDSKSMSNEPLRELVSVCLRLARATNFVTILSTQSASASELSVIGRAVDNFTIKLVGQIPDSLASYMKLDTSTLNIGEFLLVQSGSEPLKFENRLK